MTNHISIEKHLEVLEDIRNGIIFSKDVLECPETKRVLNVDIASMDLRISRVRDQL
ncbi:MAG: hypothetical protein QQN63_00720 [Nitrosopumilus sp.]